MANKPAKKTKRKKTRQPVAKTGGNGTGGAAQGPSIGVSKDDKETVQKLLDRLTQAQAQLGNARAQYVQTEQQTLKTISDTTQELEGLARALKEKAGVPESWMFKLPDMVFVPPPPTRNPLWAAPSAPPQTE
jgi:hypothetical protein